MIDKLKKIEEIEKDDENFPFLTDSADTRWLITELKAAWKREENTSKVIRKYRESVSCVSEVQHGKRIAATEIIEALKQVTELENEK